MVNFSARTEPFDFAGTPFDAIRFGAPHWAGAVCIPDARRNRARVQPHLPRPPQHPHAKDLTRVALLQQSTRPTQWAEWFELAGAHGAGLAWPQ